MNDTLIQRHQAVVTEFNEEQQKIELPALAVDAERIVSRIFPDVSIATWRRWDSSAKIPRGFRLGGRKLWRLEDLRRWAALGFPDRRTFERLRAES